MDQIIDFSIWENGAPVALTDGGFPAFDAWDEGSPVVALASFPPVPPAPVVGVPWPASLPVPRINPRMRVSSQRTSTLMDSGRIRVRRMVLSPFETIEVEWSFTLEQFAAFKSFFDVDLANGSFSTAIEIFGVNQTMAFMNSTYGVERSDSSYIVSASLEYVVTT